MAALDNFRINDPNFQNTANELANRAYDEARNRGLSHLDALKAMQKGPMGLSRDLLSVTGTKGEMHGYISESIRDSILQYRPEHLLPPPAQAAPALTPSHLTGTKMGSAPQPALTEAQLHARNTEPAVTMFTGADGNLYPAGHPMLTKQDAILSDNTAALPTRGETLDNRRSSIMMNQDPARQFPNTMPAGDGALVNNASLLPPEDDLNAFQRNVLNISNALQKTALGQAMTDPDILTKLTITHNGVEIPNTRGAGLLDKIGAVYTYFTSNGMDESSASSATLKAVHEAANNGDDAQDPTAITGPFMGGYGQESLPPAVPALASPNESDTVVTKDNGALTAPSKSTQSTVRSTTGGYTGNARGSDLPDMQIGLNERLMRMGAAGLAAGGQGSLAQLGAMFGASADVNQANRQGAMDTFKIEEERRQAHAARVAALAASKNKGAGGGDSAKVGDVRMAMAKYQNAIDMFDADTDSSMTGYNPSALFSRFIGRTVGNEDEARRLFLNELRLDSIMERVGETKGAISDAEMRLFASQAPELNSNGIVWKSWLQRQLQMQQIILNRLQTGQRIDPTAPIEETMPNLNTGGGGSTVTVINGMKFTETTPKTAK